MSPSSLYSIVQIFTKLLHPAAYSFSTMWHVIGCTKWIHLHPCSWGNWTAPTHCLIRQAVSAVNYESSHVSKSDSPYSDAKPPHTHQRQDYLRKSSPEGHEEVKHPQTPWKKWQCNFHNLQTFDRILLQLLLLLSVLDNNTSSHLL